MDIKEFQGTGGIMSAVGEIRKGDFGTVMNFELKDGNSAADLSSATSKTIKFLKPGGSVVSKAATFVTDGTDGKIQYTMVSGDLDEVGEWSAQAVVAFSGSQFSSTISKFIVNPNLEDL